MTGAADNGLLEALLAGDGAGVLARIQQCARGDRSLSDVYDAVVGPTMAEVGRRWFAGDLDIATEHRASQLLSRALTVLVTAATRNPSVSRRAVIACVEGERHVFGARALANLLYLDGWEVDYLGSDTPMATLLGFVQRHEANLVGLSATMPANQHVLTNTLAALARLPKPPLLLAGGAAASAAPTSQAIVPTSLRDALMRVRQAIGLRPEGPSLEQLLSSLGQRVAGARKARGWSQAELARRAELDRTYVSAVERGKQNLTLGAVLKLATACRLDIDGLLAGHEATRPIP